MTATIRAVVSVNGRPGALLTIENDLTGTDEIGNYRIELDDYGSKQKITARVENWKRTEHTALELLAESLRVIAEAHP